MSAIPSRRSARLAAKPAVSYAEEDDTPQMLAKKFKLGRYKVGPAPSPPRRSARLAAKARVDYTDDENDYVPAVPSAPSAGKPVIISPEEKQRHATFLRNQLTLIDSLKGNKDGRAAVTTSIMNYLEVHCLNFLAAYPRFRDTVVAKCYEFKKYEPGYKQVTAACDRLLVALGLPTDVPATLPIAPSKGACGTCPGCLARADAERAEMEKRYADVAAKKKAALEAEKAAAGKTIRATITKLSQKVDKAGEFTWEEIAGELLMYVKRYDVMEWLKANPADMMWVRGLFRAYSWNTGDTAFEHESLGFLRDTESVILGK